MAAGAQSVAMALVKWKPPWHAISWVTPHSSDSSQQAHRGKGSQVLS